jgi:hypothetical protein
LPADKCDPDSVCSGKAVLAVGVGVHVVDAAGEKDEGKKKTTTKKPKKRKRNVSAKKIQNKKKKSHAALVHHTHGAHVGSTDVAHAWTNDLKSGALRAQALQIEHSDDMAPRAAPSVALPPLPCESPVPEPPAEPPDPEPPAPEPPAPEPPADPPLPEPVLPDEEPPEPEPPEEPPEPELSPPEPELPEEPPEEPEPPEPEPPEELLPEEPDEPPEPDPELDPEETEPPSARISARLSERSPFAKSPRASMSACARRRLSSVAPSIPPASLSSFSASSASPPGSRRLAISAITRAACALAERMGELPV